MLHVALIGSGFIGGSHAEAYKNLPNYQLKAVVDINEEAGRKIATAYETNWYPTLDRALAEQEIDIVDVCLPTFLHEKFVLDAISKGKHVLCEKPVTLTAQSMENMQKAATDANVKFMVAQVIRFWPEYEKIKELYDNGDLGTVKLVYANRLAQHPQWSTWHTDPAKSGGGLYDLHIHDIDILVHLFGELDSVYAVGTQSETGCWNFVSTSLTFKNGVKAVAEGVFEMTGGYPFTMSLRAIGSDATAEYVMKAGLNLEDVSSAQRSLYVFKNEAEPEKIAIDEFDAYAKELAYFGKCIEDNAPLDKCSVDSSMYVLKVVLAIKDSLENNKLIQL